MSLILTRQCRFWHYQSWFWNFISVHCQCQLMSKNDIDLSKSTTLAYIDNEKKWHYQTKIDNANKWHCCLKISEIDSGKWHFLTLLMSYWKKVQKRTLQVEQYQNSFSCKISASENISIHRSSVTLSSDPLAVLLTLSHGNSSNGIDSTFFRCLGRGVLCLNWLLSRERLKIAQIFLHNDLHKTLNAESSKFRSPITTSRSKRRNSYRTKSWSFSNKFCGSLCKNQIWAIFNCSRENHFSNLLV